MRSSLLIVAFTACGSPTKPQTAPHTPSPDADDATAPTVIAKAGERVIALRGSNTIGFSFAPKLVRAFLESKGATEITMNDQSRLKQTVWFHSKLNGTSLWIEINAPGTKFGFQSLMKGYADIVMASRPISDPEQGKLSDYGDLTAPASENVVAMDGIAVVVDPNNTVSRLTTDQLARVFSGQIKDWSALGGPAQAIHVFGRDALSGTHDAFKSLVMNGTDAKTEKTFEDSAALAHTVETTPGGIGYVGLPYIGQTKALAIQDGDAEAMLPTQFTVATEDYALSRRLFLYLPDNPKDPLAREIVDFALSDAGQTIANEVGFVPLSLRSEQVKVPKNAPGDYAKLAAQATRLSVTFRFRQNSANVDPKGVHDLDRLTHYLAASTNKGRKVILVGFTDAQGTNKANVTLGKQRAESIATLMHQRGVTLDEVASFGDALPVAPNNTPSARSRNRRVEVWIR